MRCVMIDQRVGCRSFSPAVDVLSSHAVMRDVASGVCAMAMYASS